MCIRDRSNPGDYYIVDLYKNQVNQLYQSRPWLDRSKLAKREFVTYTARDGLEIPALLTSLKKKQIKIISSFFLMEDQILNNELDSMLGLSFLQIWELMFFNQILEDRLV
mgnify:CR=1 FL=1